MPKTVKLLGTTQVAALAGCTTSNIRRLVAAGRMPTPLPDKVGQSWVWPEDVIAAWLEQRPTQGQRPWAPA